LIARPGAGARKAPRACSRLQDVLQSRMNSGLWLVSSEWEFGSLYLEQVSARMIERWRDDKMRDGLSRRNAVKLVAVLHSIYERARKVYRVADNPVAEVAPRLRRPSRSLGSGSDSRTTTTRCSRGKGEATPTAQPSAGGTRRPARTRSCGRSASTICGTLSAASRSTSEASSRFSTGWATPTRRRRCATCTTRAAAMRPRGSGRRFASPRLQADCKHRTSTRLPRRSTRMHPRWRNPLEMWPILRNGAEPCDLKIGLPCRRSWVRVPSSASREFPNSCATRGARRSSRDLDQLLAEGERHGLGLTLDVELPQNVLDVRAYRPLRDEQAFRNVVLP
jgi:hypothetical protein